VHMADARGIVLPPNAAPAAAAPAAIVAGDHAQAGPSGKPETVVAIHHPQTGHWLLADEAGKVSTHHDFAAPHHHHKKGGGGHNGHWHVEHHGTHHRIRSSHGHHLHVTSNGQVHTTANPLPSNANFSFIADAEAKKHHLQGPNGQYIAVTGEPPEPVIAAAPSAATAIQVTPPAAAAANPNPSGK